MQQTRREFLAGVAAAVIGAEALAADPELPIIDTHQHLWNLKALRLPWLKEGGELTRNYELSDYMKATAGLGIVKSIYMEVAVAPEDREKEAAFIIGLCRERKGVPCAAVIGGDPGAEGFRNYIMKYKGMAEVKGVRHIPAAGQGKAHPFEREEFVKGVRLLGELGMSFDLCVAPTLLPLCSKLVAACPETRFILDHCGNADPKWFGGKAGEAGRREAEAWQRDMDAIGKQKRVICKISGIVARADRAGWSAADLAPVVEHCRAAFGEEWIVFGSDWPVCTRVAQPGEWVRALKEIIAGWKGEAQRALLAGNAEREYGVGI